MLLNLIKHQQPDIEKIHLYVKDPFESKHQLVTSGEEKVRIKQTKNSNAFIVYSQTIGNVYENLEDFNPAKKRKVLTVFDDMITDMETNKKLNPIVTGFFLRGGKLHISIVFISQSYFKQPKTVRLNATPYFIMKIPNKR